MTGIYQLVGTSPILSSDNCRHPPGQDPGPEDTRGKGILQEEDQRAVRQTWLPSDLGHHVCVVHLPGGNKRAPGEDTQCSHQGGRPRHKGACHWTTGE